MISLSPVIAHLKEHLTGSAHNIFKVVAGAGEYAALADKTPAYPCAYVVRAAEQVHQGGVGGAIFDLRFDVALGVAAMADATGQAADSVMANKRNAVRLLLQGWHWPNTQVDDAADDEIWPSIERPCAWTGGALVDILPSALWWRDSYQIKIYLPSN